MAGAARALVVINAHRRELDLRLREVFSLAETRSDLEIGLLVSCPVEPALATDLGRHGIRVVSTLDSLRGGVPAGGAEHEFEDLGVAPLLWRVFVSDRHIFDLADVDSYASKSASQEDVAVAFASVSAALRETLLRHRPDYVLPGAPDNYLSAMVTAMCNWLGIPCAFTWEWDMVPSGRLMVVTNLELGNPAVETRMQVRDEDPGTPGSNGSHATIGIGVGRAGNSGMHARLGRHLSGNPAAVGATPSVWDAFTGKLRAVYPSLRNWAGSSRDWHQRGDPAHHVLTTNEGRPAELAANAAYRTINRRRNYRDLKRLSLSECGILESGVPTVIVPLHFQPEAFVTFAAPLWSDQRVWVRALSVAAPPGLRILVREHPAQDPGLRPLGFYEELSRLPQVSLCDPTVPTASLLAMEPLRAVVTLGGSMAIEAAALGVPAAMMIPSVASTFPGVGRIDPGSPSLAQDFQALTAIGMQSPPGDALLGQWFHAVSQETVPVGSRSIEWQSLIEWLENRATSGPEDPSRDN